MKKFRFYVPVLAIACMGILFSATSCVDDSESQSVTDLRGARAEQLRAEAALAVAQAEAAKIVANAEAALKAAQAKREEAEAKVLEAEAAYRAAQTEADKAKWAVELDKAKAEARKAIALADNAVKQAEYDLEVIKLTMETELLNLQNELDKAKINDPVLAEAISKYSGFIGQVNTKKSQIATKNLTLVKMKALLADNTASEEEITASIIKGYNENIADYEKWITSNEIQIENWKALLAKGGADVDAEIKELKKQRDELIYNKSADVIKARDAAVAVSDAAYNAVYDFRNLGTVKNYLYVWDEAGLQMVEYYTVGELKNRLTNEKNNLTAAEKTLSEYEKKYNDAEKVIKDLYDAKLAADKAVDDANTAYDKAVDARNTVYADPASTAAQKTAADAAVAAALAKLNEAFTAQSAANTKYYNAQNDLDSYQSSIIYQKSNIADYNSRIENLEKAIAEYNNSSDAPRKLEDANRTAYKAMLAAQKDYDDLRAEIDALYDEINKLSTIQYSNGYYSNTIDIETIKSIIKDLEDNNAYNETYIANANRAINEAKEDKTIAIANWKQAITNLEAEIAKLEVELSVLQKQADAAKVVVDARTK
jgi:chromosome segregation ATPase